MRKIIHVDMDCFYAAVEMRDAPELRDIPIAIGGTRKERGVISTANYLAREFGVASAMPTATALRLCPHLTLLPGRFPVYRQVSAQLQEIFQRFTPLVEPVSLDEAYLDVTDCQLFHCSATLIAQEIRRLIRTELRLTASAGVAPIKFLAKIASDINKPDGLCVIDPGHVESFIQQLSLKRIPGVGKVTAQKLADHGLYTCQDIQQTDLASLLKRFGQFGRRLWERSHGIDPAQVVNARQRKSVGVERTLNQDIYEWQDCLDVIEKLYPELERRVRREQQDLRIARQGVKMKFTDFQQTTQEHVWSVLDKNDLIAIAQQTYQQRRGERGVRLIGLHITLLDPLIERQLLFPF